MLSLACALLVCSPTLGAEFALEGTYGTAAGCAIASHARDIPDGHAEAVSAKTMWDGSAICTVTNASEPSTDADGNTLWDVKVNCQAGDENAEIGTVNVKLSADKSVVTTKTPDKVGPMGRFRLCQ